MHIPASTYRIQFNPNFTFESAQAIVPYLSELGISDLYASPIFKARQGSDHGYDVVDPNQINSALGGREKFAELIGLLQRYQLGWIQDIVPNHMAYDSENLWLMDVLEHGEDSDYHSYFDIDWNHPYEDIKGRILVPLLGNFFGHCLENGEIQLSYGESGLQVNYYDLHLPIRASSHAKLIARDLGRLRQKLGQNHPDFIRLLGILYIFNSIAEQSSGRLRREQGLFAKSLLWELYSNPDIQQFIDENILFFNGVPGHPESFDALDNLLSEQHYRLSFWKVGAEEINYRRFFTVNELISLRVENKKVFENTHHLIHELISTGKMRGLRIDHIDGLYDPSRYLERLREKMGDVYIAVEKILELEQEYFARFEELPRDWPIQGTSGYDFLNCVNGLFCRREQARRLTEIYVAFTDLPANYEELILDKEQLIIDKNLAGDIQNLAILLKEISRQYRYGRDFTLNGLGRAVRQVLALFPIYRTYVNLEGKLDQRDRVYVEDAVRRARAFVPQLLNELNFIEKVLLLDFDEYLSQEEQFQWLHFVLKFQQLTSPLMAKGVEDTLLYVFNRFLALNEVGGKPSQSGISASAFHTYCQHQKDYWPHTMNTTSTHDTKRSEDVRSRLMVLSEIPDEWEALVMGWRDLNQDHKVKNTDRLIPDANDEYFLYQTLVGSFPFYDYEYPTYVERIKAYSVKAVREAKVHTAWLRPDTDYEDGFIQFVEKLLDLSEDNLFLKQLKTFHQRISFYGILNSLSQTLLKITAPGLPDFYQGNELWDFSLVDPDNRRPVDFKKRIDWLQDIKCQIDHDITTLLEDLKSNWMDGRLKLFLTRQGLATRTQYLEVYQRGTYQPIDIMGQYHNHVVAFARRLDQDTLITVVPRFFTDLVEPGEYPLSKSKWDDTSLDLPPELSTFSWLNTLTGERLEGGDSVLVGQILQQFPVAILVNQPSDLAE